MAVQIKAAMEEVRQNDSERTSAASSSTSPQWGEGGRSYWDAIQASLAELTEADKEAIHASLKE